MGEMGTSPLTFTGISKYSDDFQTILSRAVSIAALPLKDLQNQQADVLQKEVAATNLQAAIGDLAGAFASLGKVGASKALGATSSDTSKVYVVSSNADAPATYTISDITSVAKVASETSVSGYADPAASPVSANGHLTLTVGSTHYSLTLPEGKNNLQGLRDAINASGAPISATILTTSTGATPNYLSVSANASGETALTLVDEDGSEQPPELLTALNQGSNATFKLNGVLVSKSSNSINDVVPGVSFNIAATAPGESVTISVASDRGRLSSALQGLVSKYNTAVKQVDSQIGPNAGLLSGDPLISQTSDIFRQFSSFSGTKSIKSLADVGLQFSQTGELKFDQDTFNKLSDTQIGDALEFVSLGTGLGGFQSKLEQISDPVSGLIQIAQDQYTKTDHRLTGQIADLLDRITAMQTRMSDQLHTADALLATLDSQQSVLSATLQSLSFTLYGKQQQ
jgi:flagellar hook-associated protein 2